MESRSTFRHKASEVAWQKQLRDRYTSEGAPDIDLSLKTAVVRPISRALAEQVILKYEWLGTMQRTAWHFGLFFGPYCAGVTCVGKTNCVGGTLTHELLGVERDQFAILARGACVHWSPTGANSKLVSFTCRLMRSLAPQIKVMIAYSDSDAGEIGTIYQACNWTYIGKGASTTQYVAPNGYIYDKSLINRLVKKNGCTREAQIKHLLANGYREQPSNAKGRYVCILDKSDAKLIAHIEAMRQEYPKRDKH